MAYPYYPGYQPYPQFQQVPQQIQPVPDQLQQYRMNQNMQSTQNSGTNQDERIWVQGEGAAQAYLVAPNSFVRLWDSQSPVFYEKRADASGKPYMEIYEYTRRGSQTPNDPFINQKQQVDYMDELKALKARVEALEKGVNTNDQ